MTLRFCRLRSIIGSIFKRMKEELSQTVLLRAFGRVVRMRRTELELTQEEVAHRSGLHRTYIGDIERGTRNVALFNLWRLASALDLEAEELMRRIGREAGDE
jgi:transcriptional regulator with XRE-family HTH domain